MLTPLNLSKHHCQGFFITGTDTDVGKTRVTVNLLHLLNEQGLSTIALKPVASGAKKTTEGLRNDDAMQLQKAASIQLPYKIVNPLTYEPFIAPHIAAELLGEHITIADLVKKFQPLLSCPTDITLVEGAGGWLTPLNKTETLADFAVQLGLPVIVVVGMRLGCLNHSQLTIHSIQQSGLPIAGWVANCIQSKMPQLEANIETLKHMLKVPHLATIPYQGQLPKSIVSQLRAPLEI